MTGKFHSQQGRISRSMQTIEINGPKGVDFGDERENPPDWRQRQKGAKKAGGAKRGVECGGQSIIKPALSLLGSVNEGRSLVKKRGRMVLKNGLRE